MFEKLAVMWTLLGLIFIADASSGFIVSGMLQHAIPGLVFYKQEPTSIKDRVIPVLADECASESRSNLSLGLTHISYTRIGMNRPGFHGRKKDAWHRKNILHIPLHEPQ